MSRADSYMPELHDLLDEVCEGTIGEAQSVRLEELLNLHPEARYEYLRMINLHGMLCWDVGCERSEGDFVAPAASTPDLYGGFSHGTFAAFSQNGPLSYLIATVVLCLMLLGAWVYQIDHNNNAYVDNNRKSTTTGQHEYVVVGRITGMRNCRWSIEDTQTVVGASVALDREYALSSGLLEITYKYGAKVILEGPCTFKVDSDVGGYLAVGKLTARVETKGSGFRGQGPDDRDQRTEVRGRKSHPSSFIPHPSSLFSIRTPTAVVTDLGTEFGVEVAENGDTTSYVFQGTIVIKAEIRDSDNHPATTVAGVDERELKAGESIRVSRVRETHHDHTTTDIVRFTHTPTPPEFVREMPQLQTARGSMAVMDSSDFAWKYEMDVDPLDQDLDANPGPDWMLLRGAMRVNGDGTATLADDGKSYGYLTSNGPGDPKHSPGHVWNNITAETGYTVELRVKVIGTVRWYGHDLGLYLMASDSTDESSSTVVITRDGTLWDTHSRYLIDNNRNDNDFHVFRIAQEAGGNKYYVWRDGVLVRISEGFQPPVWNRVQFGDMGTGSGPNLVDYVRVTAGAYAPPKSIAAPRQPKTPEERKEVPSED